MKAPHSKSALLYDQVKQGLQSGQYAPGERIDPASLAQHFRTSQTPVRFALYRLVGEGLLDDHAREGFHVPLPTEFALRDLYNWMQRLLTMACDIGFGPGMPEGSPFTRPAPDDDLASLTQRLFDSIARATGHLALYRATEVANAKLAPIRRVELKLLDDTLDELAKLCDSWTNRNALALRSTLTEYHDSRERIVPRIIAAINGESTYAP